MLEHEATTILYGLWGYILSTLLAGSTNTMFLPDRGKWDLSLRMD